MRSMTVFKRAILIFGLAMIAAAIGAVASTAFAQTNPPAALCGSGGGTSATTPVQPTFTASIPAGMIANGDVFCRIINQNGAYVTDPAEIGSSTLTDKGILQAVDVFGLRSDGQSVVPFGNVMQICLLGTGDMMFTNAATQPRTVQQLAASYQNGYTCAFIGGSGTVVLTPTTVRAFFGGAVVAVPVAGESPLSGCEVTTSARANLRSEPLIVGDVITSLPVGVTLPAEGQVAGWYRVLSDDGAGWISADLVDVSGSCGQDAADTATGRGSASASATPEASSTPSAA